VFPPGRSYLESLTSGLDDWDFAVFLLTPDDKVISRWFAQPAPRDNIVFEAGLCMGRLGRTRTLLFVPEEPEPLKLPSDISGIELLFYEKSVDEQLEKLLGIIADLGPRTRLAIHTLDE
jgi:predicted nucleotide-binding protein